MKVTRTVPLPDALKQVTEPLERAVSDSYPWAIRPLHSKSWCYLAGWVPVNELAGIPGDAHPYICRTPYRDVITQDPSAFFAHPQSLQLTFDNISDETELIFGLTRSGGANGEWSAQRITTPSSVSESISIQAAEF